MLRYFIQMFVITMFFLQPLAWADRRSAEDWMLSRLVYAGETRDIRHQRRVFFGNGKLVEQIMVDLVYLEALETTNLYDVAGEEVGLLLARLKERRIPYATMPTFSLISVLIPAIVKRFDAVMEKLEARIGGCNGAISEASDS